MVASHFGTAIGQYVAVPLPDSPSLPVSLPPRAGVLAGRENLLADLHALLADGDAPWPRTAVLCGLGGAGKTSVATEYAHRHLAEVAVAWQLAAEDQTVLAAEFSLLAAQLGVRGVADVRDPVRSVHSALAAYPAEWLLIFDNVHDDGSVRAFLPPAGRGRVLITSQNAHWSAARLLEVPVLDSQVAAAFLVNRTTDPDLEAAVALSGQLGGLPLALEQAAAYVKATGSTLAEYLELLRERRSDVLKRGEVAGHPDTVAATLGLASSRLERDAPAAAGLLRLLACLAPEPTPLGLLLANGEVPDGLDDDVASALGPLLGDQLARRDAVAALRRYSLVTLTGNETVLVHRLVQAVTLDQAGAAHAKAWRQAAAAIVEAALPVDPTRPSAWPAFALLLPHAQAVLPADSPAMGKIGRYLGHSGSHGTARDVLGKLLAAQEQTLGPEHPETLATQSNLALWTGRAGDAAAARDQYAKLLSVEERVFGPEHSWTLVTRNNLADWTGQAGDSAAARNQLADLLPILDRVIGHEDPVSLAARNNLAGHLGGAGDATAARDLFAEVLAMRERVLGAEHPDTLITRNNLALWTGWSGNAAAARDLFAGLLAIRERVLGAEHPDTLITRNSLAGWTYLAGNAASARDQLAELLPIMERILGPEHPATQNARVGLAITTKEAGQPRDQLPYSRST